METCIATSNVPTSQYKMYHDNVPCGKQIYRYGGLRKTVTSSRQGKPYQCWYRRANRVEICVLASFIFIKKNKQKLKSLLFRLHIWLHYWPFVPREIKKSSIHVISQNILNLTDTENTEDMRFKARLHLQIVPHHQQKTGHRMSWNKNHIKNKLYDVELCPQEIQFSRKYLDCDSCSNITSNWIQCAHTLCVQNT